MRRGLLVLLIACGGSTPATLPVEAPSPRPAPPPPVIAAPACSNTAPDALVVPVPVASTFMVPDSHEVEWFAPAWKKVGLGQTISFGTSAIDQDLDETRTDVTRMPLSARFDPITQTVVWTPAIADMPKVDFEVTITQPGRAKKVVKTFSIDVVKDAQPVPVAATQPPIIETLLLIHAPKRLEEVNKQWPLDRLLEVGAGTFKLQIPEPQRSQLQTALTGQLAYEQMLTGLAQTNQNPRLDPKSPQFDRASFGDPKAWHIVAFRPRIDKAWTELRVVYKAPSVEPVYAMFRLRPVVEYVPALPRPDEERDANNKIFLGMVAKDLMKNGGPNPAFVKDEAAHGKAVAQLMTDVMTFDDTKTKPYLHGFEIGIAMEARMGGGSARNADGSYKSGDGWGWNAMKPFRTSDGATQAYVDVAIPGFWTDTQPSKDGKTWEPKCATKFNPADPKHDSGYEILCRKTMGFVDLPATSGGKPIQSKVDANNLFLEHKKSWMTTTMALEDGRRDLGEENGITCSQCHIRNFGMHDYHDRANVDPSAGVPKAPNHAIATTNFQIVPTTEWSAFTLEFLKHQECRGKLLFEQFIGPEAAKGLTCPLAK
ncbi:MAG TPA: hypothetical protein VFQ65_28080 [Kofleriaceae bacterium]|nr:hypothetical protein [Kofleriaceae bacterium]